MRLTDVRGRRGPGAMRVSGTTAARTLTFAFLLVGIWAAPAGANTFPNNTFQPTRYDDPPPDGCPPADCSLREAVIAANATAGTDAILLQPGKYSLTRSPTTSEPELMGGTQNPRVGDLDIAKGPQVEVIGLGPESTAIESGDYSAGVPSVDRVFDIDSGASLRLAAVAVMLGDAKLGFFGHGHGGGIHNHGTLVSDSVTLTSNLAMSGWGGGGLTNAPGATATLRNVTVVNNRAEGQSVASGGGIENLGTLTLNNGTIGWNDAFNNPGKPGAGLFSAGKATLTNTIVASNFFASDCHATTASAIVSAGYNLSGDASCPFTATGDKKPPPGSTIDPMFTSVYDANFFVRLLELLPGSPAIDAGSPSGCEQFDARALSRPQDGDADGAPVCDMGAYERDGPPVVTSVVPASGAVGVSPEANIQVSFNEAMDQASAEAAFSLVRSGTTTPIAGTFTWSGYTMTFDPSPTLDKGATYIAGVTTGATDLAGNQLLAPSSWQFQTAQMFGPPITLSAAGRDADDPQVAIDADGDAVFTWRRFDGANWRVQARARSAAGVLSAVQTMSGPGQDAESPRVAIDADGDAVFTWRRFDGANWRVQAGARSAAGGLSAVQTLTAPGQNAADPDVAVDADGDAVFAWRRFDGANSRVHARARTAAGALSAVQTLSAPGQDAFWPQAAVDADGDAVFAWQRSDGANVRVEARARSAGGVLSAVQTLSAPGQDAGAPQVAVDTDGDAVFAWGRFDGTNYRVQTVARTAAGSLSAVQTLSPAGQDAFGPQVAVDADGDAVFAWERFDGSNWRVQARARSAVGGVLSAVRNLSAAGQDANDPQVAVDADGDAVLTWRRFDGTYQRVQGRARTAAGLLSAVQTLSAAGQQASKPQVAVAADGDPAATWRRFHGTNWRIEAATGS